MSCESTLTTAYRFTNVTLAWTLKAWRNSSECGFTNNGDEQSELFSPVLSSEGGAEWKFAMRFGKRDQRQIRRVLFRLYCTKLPDNAQEQKCAVKGKMEVKDIAGSTSVGSGSCDTYLVPGRSIFSNLIIEFHSIPSDVTFSADLDVGGWPETSSASPSAPGAPQNAPQSSLAPILAALAADSLFTDLTIEVGGASIAAHRNVLAARSPVLRAMLSADMQEGREARIVLEDVSRAAWEAFQTFLYTDRLKPNVSRKTDLLLQLLLLSDKYEVDPLKARVEAALVALMTKDNAVEMFEAVEKFRVPKVKDAAADTIVRNWAALRKEKKVMAWMTSGSDLGAALFEKLHF